jgi:hypothetical protein
LDSLVFQTSAGPLRWRNLHCWVDESDPDQLLVVDRPTMERMGYSADALLVAAKRKFETYGREENLSDSERITSDARKPFVRFMRHKDEALYRSPAAEEECEFEEAMFTPLTGPAEAQQTQIIEILDQKVKESGSNGISESGQAQLRELLDEYSDVFRVSFAKDPPIDVEPMEIKLQVSAGAYGGIGENRLGFQESGSKCSPSGAQKGWHLENDCGFTSSQRSDRTQSMAHATSRGRNGRFRRINMFL